MAERPPEQALVEEARRLADRAYELANKKNYAHGSVFHAVADARDATRKLADENKELREKLEKLGYDFAAEVTEIRERAAADCVRLEGEIAAWREQMERFERWAGEQNEGNAFAGQARAWALNCLSGAEFNEP